MKTICFDLRALQIGHEKRGIGMYIKSVLEHMPADGNKYLFYCFDKNNPIEDLHINTKLDYRLVQTPTLSTSIDSPKNAVAVLKLIQHDFAALRKFKPDTFVQFDFMLGLPRWRNIKTIVIGYDLIPLIKKNEYIPSPAYAWNHSIGKKAKLRGVARAAYYQTRYSLQYKAFKRADKVVCISEHSKQTFIDILGLAPDEVSSIPLAPIESSKLEDLTRADSINKPYLFYIGGTDSRKRVQDIVYAFNIVRSRGHDMALVLAGNEFRKAHEVPSDKARAAILASPYLEDIHLEGFVSDEEKLGFYKKAHAFVFASTYEGFGLPVLEALKALCPVITYDNSSIPEAAGDAAILVPTGDYLELAHSAIKLFDADLRKKNIRKGVMQSSKFSWNQYTELFHKALVEEI